MPNFYDRFLKLNPLLWLVHSAAGHSRALPAKLEHLTKPILKAYAITDDETDTYPEVIVIHKAEQGTIDFLWRERRVVGESLRQTISRAYVNATAEWDRLQNADVYAVMAERNRNTGQN